MMAELVNRPALKRRVRACLKTAQVNATAFTVLFLGLNLVLTAVDLLSQGPSGTQNLLSIFVGVLTSLVGLILQAGFVMYCMAVRRSERAEFLTLFDGFSMVGKIILLAIVMYFFISLWSMLFVFPGIWAAFRYRFALFNLYENPDLGVLEALNMSKRQTMGYKFQLFIYDLSYYGWSLLSGLPTLLLTIRAFYAAAGMFLSGAGLGGILAAVQTNGTYIILSCIWAFAVYLFYLPQMQCGELAYFEAAKRTSGIGVDNGPSDFDVPTIQIPRSGPDNMGGL